MNAANYKKSERLRRVLKLLREGGEHSTRGIMASAHVCAVSACVSELRAQGFNITCKRNHDVWYYKLNRPYRKCA